MPDSSLRIKFAIAALVGLAAMVSFVAYDWYRTEPPGAMARATYVGRQTCAICHQTEHKLWLGSDHDLAMDLATDETVLADFNNSSFTRNGLTTRFFRRDGKFMVNTEGPDGQLHDYEIKYTFGVRPLQQYMVEFPDGRVQVLRVSWDTRNDEWFEVTPPDVPDERILPGDPLHWTGIAQNWNTTCADCHSTNVHKNYNVAANTYHTTFEEIDVGCEECHGPGSVHVALAGRWSPFWDRKIGYGLPVLKDKLSNTQIETCAKCHARRYQVHESFRPGAPLLDFYEPSLLAATLYESDGQILDEVYEYGSFLQSKMHANHVRCTDCHDPHSLKLTFSGNSLCTQCHLPSKYDTETHHHHAPDSTGAQCIACHMPSRLYMVIDERRDHSFKAPRPDLTVELGVPNACNSCHTKPEETAEWAAEAVVKWYGPVRRDDPDWARAFAAAHNAKPEAEQLLLGLVEHNATPAIVRATAIDLLGNYSSSQSHAACRNALRDVDPLVRTTAVRRLSGDTPELLASDLIGALDDSARSVRLAAAARLADLSEQQVPAAHRTAFRAALGELEESQNLTLDHGRGHLVLGSRARRRGRPVEAIEHLQTAIKLEPYLSGPRAELASLMQDIGGDKAEIHRLRSEEVALLERDSKLAPENALIRYELGMLYYLLDQLDEAELALVAAVERAPQSFEILMALALLHEKRYELGDDEKQFLAAKAAIKRLNELVPNDPRARSIASRLLETRRQKQASK